jgi:hypothetical protein
MNRDPADAQAKGMSESVEEGMVFGLIVCPLPNLSPGIGENPGPLVRLRLLDTQLVSDAHRARIRGARPVESEDRVVEIGQRRISVYAKRLRHGPIVYLTKRRSANLLPLLLFDEKVEHNGTAFAMLHISRT